MSQAIAIQKNTLLACPGCRFERTGLVFEDEISYPEWESLGDALRQAEGAIQWWIGDWLNFGERQWGEKYSQAIEATELNYQTLANYAYTARQVDFSLRKEKLSYHHHHAVAPLEPFEQETILDAAIRNGWTVSQTRAAVQSFKRIKESPLLALPDNCRVVSDLAELVADGELYHTIYADCPWQYSNQGTRSATDNHYSTMTVDDLCALPVAQVADENAHLHFWTTNAFLFEAKRVMEAWGFEYKSCFIWCKPQMGIGNYWRVSHEFLLFGIRGSLPFQDRGQMSWAAIDRGEHSAKPEEVRHRVESVSPAPYLEMFGRITRPGWTIFGNQVWNPADQPKFQPIEGPLFGS